MPDGPEPLQYLIKHSHKLARQEELERRSMAEIQEDVLYAEAEEAYSALSTLLDENAYFFGTRYNLDIFLANRRRPGLLDTAVFAYTWSVLDRLDNSKLAEIINKFRNLVQHATRVKELVYS